MGVSRITQFFYLLACLFLLVVTLKIANAADDVAAVDAKKATIGGSGCSALSAKIENHPVSGDFEIVPTKLNASTTANGTLNRKTCMISMPVHVPAGKKLVVSNACVITESQVPGSSSATAELQAFTAGKTGKQLISQLTSANNGTVRANLKEILNESECGKDTNLRINASIIAQGTNSEASVKELRVRYKFASCDSAQ